MSAAGIAKILRHRTRARAATAAWAAVVALALVQPLPASAVGNWTLRMSDNFDGTALNSKWSVLNGSESGFRSASNAIVRDGKLILRTQKVNGVWKGAGVTAAQSTTQTYGKYEMRVRFDRGYGVRCVALLWPATGDWPPELDFYEIPASNTDRTVNTLTNHYGTRANHRMIHARYEGDFQRWHTVGMEWTPTQLRYYMDGVLKVTISREIPKEPMWLGITTRPGSSLGVKPSAATPPIVDLEIDWVKVYRRA